VRGTKIFPNQEVEMEYINAVIGDMEMYVPVNDKLGKFILLARRRVNFQKHIAKMRKVYRGRIESGLVIMDAEFIYVFEDVLEDKGYVDVIHSQIVKSSVEYGKILYDLFREDKSIRYLMSAHGYKQEQLQNVIRNFFEALKKIIF
jgi:hypothetical protein